MASDSIPAITSLSPAPWRFQAQRVAIQSWRDAGLCVISLNHPSEIELMRSRYDVEWEPVHETNAHVFGKHFVPIHAALECAARNDGPALLINSDIQLRLSPWELRRLRWLSKDGLCYFVRHNHHGDLARATREPSGIDAFLFHPADAGPLERSALSFGQPFWDYLFPYRFAAAGLGVFAVEYPAAFHRIHQQQWSWRAWQQCAEEFGRLTGVHDGDYSREGCTKIAHFVSTEIQRNKRSIAHGAPHIREWVQKTFANGGPKVFLELGSHMGTDTHWLSSIDGVTVHAFEPDPRNRQPPRDNVIQNAAAVADRDGRAPFVLSRDGWGIEWTHSSSLRAPKNHLHRYPVSFGERIEVEVVSMDTYCRGRGIDYVDFVWADIQGSEGDMIRGGRETLARTRYLFTEFSDDEMYEGQITLREMLSLLPEFRVVEMWEDDVLLENQNLKSP